MQSFTVDPRDGSGTDSCDTCCCASAIGRPGEINPWQINYAPWSLPIYGHGLSSKVEFSITKKTSGAVPTYSNTHYGFGTNSDIPLAETVATNETPAGAYVYTVVPFTGPNSGSLAFNADGTFVYTPDDNSLGVDSFWYQMVEGSGKAVKYRVDINVTAPAAGIVAAALPNPAAVIITQSRVVVNSNLHYIQFPVELTYAAVAGDIHMIEVRASVLDCDGNNFYHLSCYDLTVGKCR